MAAAQPHRTIFLPKLRSADPKSLLLGTALASTLLLGSVLAPAPAAAQTAPCVLTPPSNDLPIRVASPAAPIICNNPDDRTANAASFYRTIDLYATNSGNFIRLNNSGELSAINPADDAFGIAAETSGTGNFIRIENHGDITARTSAAVGSAYGIRAISSLDDSPITIINSGDLTASAVSGAPIVGTATGIEALVRSSGDILIENSGDISALSNNSMSVRGIYAFNSEGGVTIRSQGDKITATSTVADAYGIWTDIRTGGVVFISNDARIDVTSNRQNAMGITVRTQDIDGDVTIVNTGTIVATNPIGTAHGIHADTNLTRSSITVTNSGDIFAFADVSYGIYGRTSGADSPVSITNSGHINSGGIGIHAYARSGSRIDVINSGALATLGDGIFAETAGVQSEISIRNRGDIRAQEGVNTTGDGIYAFAAGPQSPIVITNTARIDADDDGIDAMTFGVQSSVTIVNAGTIRASHVGMEVTAGGTGGVASIVNSGAVSGGYAGVAVLSDAGIDIVNTGHIAAGSHRAIYATGASTRILNTSGGIITGFVQLTDQADTFLNQSGGVFETKLTSDFGGGSDLFQNRTGGTVLAATDAGAREHSAVVNLERFDNRGGTISLIDGATGDTFRISNTAPPSDSLFFDSGLAFNASGNSTVGVDAFLGGPGSEADHLIIDGNVTGRTTLAVNNVNFGPGVFNSSGIPVVFVGGNVNENAFFLKQPIDTGFFDYDLFFVPTGSGFFELRSFLGGGAFVLPQLTTAAQDLWHAGSSTWFDRTADLRVLLAGGAAPTAYAPTGSKLDDGVQAPGAVPAVWVRGSGSWLDRDDSETVRAYGRTYEYKLDRELDTFDFQVGLDLGTRDVLGSGDILVFGALAGFVHGDLDYKQLARGFDLSGGQVGGYATYLSGGLFVDTLLNVHFLEIDTPVLGFPGSLDATTLGLRTDAGYRFGSFTGGAFIEPLATIAVTWADLDGFSVGGNSVSFDDDANVRGRLGLRVGTSYDVTTDVKMEPFLIGSVWGNLSGDTNAATLTSSGTVFQLRDELDDVWGEVSAGVNFFNFGTGTTVFAKVDVTFGDDLSGVGGKAGMRVAW